jgi:hypothetical protein
MKKVIIPAERLNAQRTATNIRSLVLEENEALTFVAFLEGTTPRNGKEVFNDALLFNSDRRGAVKMTVSELNRLQTKDGALTNAEDFTVPHKLVIKSSSDRKSAAGQKIYPTGAYNGATEFYAAIQKGEQPDYNKLVESGLKDPNTKPVQDYTVEAVA